MERGAVQSDSFLAFAGSNWRPLCFGILHSFFSMPGQTLFIGLFVNHFADSFDLGASAVGAIYLVGTTGSAATLLFLGHLIDRVPLRTFSSLCVAGLAAACAIAATAPNAVALGIGVYALRLTGQGLMVHIEATATARTFTENRGRALGITALGLPIASAALPPLAIAGIEALGWRWTYGVLAIFLILAVLPVSRYLARFTRSGEPAHGSRAGSSSFRQGLALMMASRYVWAALPAIAILPFLGTGLMFNVSVIARDRGWPGEIIAAGFPLLAASSIASLFISGRLIDRFSARTVFLAHALPLLAAYILLAVAEAPWIFPVAMMLVGCSEGAYKTCITAMWAEIFPLGLLGTIRSVAVTYLVLMSAAAPAVFGLLFDAGWSPAQLLGVFAGAGLVATAPPLIYRVARGSEPWKAGG